MIPIALVGAAHIHTPKFVDMLLRRRDVRVALVWDHDLDRATRVASRLGAQVTPELDAVWADGDIRAVIICSETVRHGDLVRPAIDAGKHLFVEKPLAIGGAEAHDLASAIEADGVLFSTGYLKRSLGSHRFLRDAIASGVFGAITRIHASIAHAGALAGWFDDEWAWMSDPTQAGFGALGDNGTHAVDLVLWLLGEGVEVARVSAWTGSVSGRYGSIDEQGWAAIELADGSMATLWASWLDLAEPVALSVAGTQAYASVSGGHLTMARRDRAADGLIEPAVAADLAHPFELFLDALGSGSADELVSAREAARCCAIVEALYQSAASGAWVKPAFFM